jgi:hypothetical protein
MDAQPKPIDSWLVRIKTALEIIAIPVVAYWGLTRFRAEDAPALEQRARVQGELFWHERSDAECVAEYRIKFENIGKSSIEVGDGRLRAWLLEDVATTDAITYVDPKDPRGRKVLVDEPVKEYLMHRYAPGVVDEVGLMFVVKRAPGKIVIFLIEGTSHIDGAKPEPWFDHRWDYVCDEASAAAGNNERTG